MLARARSQRRNRERVGGLRSSASCRHPANVGKIACSPAAARCDIYHVYALGPRPLPSLYYYPSLERVWVSGDPYVGSFIERFGVTSGHERYDYNKTYVLRLDGRLTVLPR